MLGNVCEWCEDVWTEITTRRKTPRVRPPRDPGRLVEQRRAARARGVPRPQRALGPEQQPGLPLCRVQGSGTGRSERATGSGASGGARRSGCGAPRRPRHCERSGLDQPRRARNGWRFVRDADAGAREFGRRASRASHDDAPKWASAIGRDKYGLWAEFTIEGNVAKPPTKRAARKKKSAPPKVPLGPVRQRLRWIPPGRFLMGSPADEEGRYSDEGPQHEVTIAEGFWMFDTPCTQALWEALMGENPSEFKSPDRPVENVSWEDCRKFVERN